MKLHFIARSLFIAGLTVFTISSQAAQSLRLAMKRRKPIPSILRRKNSMNY